ncbi:Serine carboxypeptidase A [Cladobotryum mycophilum]|uniref:Serine carboxypeptidase A n=1 Tax=Cladobotryum mycophilum TaxID=491253 RepID=A0ABR0ST44_9HYPO
MNLRLLLFFASSSLAQFVHQDAAARNLTVIKSPGSSNVTISFKEPQGACRTAFDSQKQYTGWVNVPGEFPTNLFFWFFEARQRTDSLTVWLNGGPGSSSMFGLFDGNGPCEIIEKGLDEYDTVAREWGWDRASNMLFIDQPNQVGFSYDVPTNGTVLLDGTIEYPPVPYDESLPSWAQYNGTFSSPNANNTANTTAIAAMATWHMIQGFMSAFPQYQPSQDSPVGVNLFLESYGGRYGPVFAETWEGQNGKRLTGDLDRDSTLEIRLTSLGIINGCVDTKIQAPQTIRFAIDNTYGYHMLSQNEAKEFLTKLEQRGGCMDLLNQCEKFAAVNDPLGRGNNAAVNDICNKADYVCAEIANAFEASGRSSYDIASPSANPTPSQLMMEYLNWLPLQRAIGTPVNFTMSSNNVFTEFYQTGDISRDGNVLRLAALLNKGIRVGMIYGDRDYICNWFGGEQVSLAVAKAAGRDYRTKFPAAGYAPIVVNGSYVGGVVRQYGNLSFSRVYQAGHSVAWYQPETAFQLFARIMTGKSVSTGDAVDLATYNTTGPANATMTAQLPPDPKPTCYVRAFGDTCDQHAIDLANSGEGVVINGVLYNSSQEWPLATKTGATSAASPTKTMTGVYSATSSPKSEGSLPGRGLAIWGVVAIVLECVWLM